MVTKQNYHKSGFTIIEVVLVLAIAGLIFLAVFLALPALQRSQHDQDRKTSVSKVVSQLTQFQANNRGKLPSDINGQKSMPAFFIKSFKDGSGESVTEQPWKYFYTRYLITESDDEFRDPSGSKKTTDGSYYKLEIKDSGDKHPYDTFEDQENTIVVTLGTRCDGEALVKAGPRNFAVTYRGEGGSVICEGA